MWLAFSFIVPGNIRGIFESFSKKFIKSNFITSDSPNFKRMKIEILKEYRELIVPSYHSIFSHKNFQQLNDLSIPSTKILRQRNARNASK